MPGFTFCGFFAMKLFDFDLTDGLPRVRLDAWTLLEVGETRWRK